ncbi:MAG: hypothetical protein H6812_03605 [Phycisphaeraceae bacterium]|nr:hypothetical protein [Phycisphaerales bacterium]MCB9842323.1 hypothetical protein [Phycisphaeraceae bacterium]
MKPTKPLSYRIAENVRFLKGAGVGLVLFGHFMLTFPGSIIQELLYVGRGIRQYQPAVLVFTNGILLTLAFTFRNFAGDLVFLVWGVYFCKTIAEAVWASRRRSAGSIEHSLHYGVCILSPLGIYHPYAALVVPAGLGIGLLAMKGGTIIGLLMIQGSIGAYLMILRARMNEAAQRSQQMDMAIEAQWRQQDTDHDAGGARQHQRVRVR